jgi:hypothetical protein
VNERYLAWFDNVQVEQDQEEFKLTLPKEISQDIDWSAIRDMNVTELDLAYTSEDEAEQLRVAIDRSREDIEAMDRMECSAVLVEVPENKMGPSKDDKDSGMYTSTRPSEVTQDKASNRGKKNKNKRTPRGSERKDKVPIQPPGFDEFITRTSRGGTDRLGREVAAWLKKPGRTLKDRASREERRRREQPDRLDLQ